jgi:Tol biopolymer transport system component
MVRRVLFLAAMAPLLGCSAPLRHAVKTTEAATGLEQVTRSGANELDPAVSRDARAIAYESAASPDANPHVEVMALDVDLRRDRSGVVYSSGDELGLEPTWLPDGSGIVFVSSAQGGRRLVETFGDGVRNVHFVASAGDPDLSAAWPDLSPDGRSLAVALGGIGLFRTGWRRTVWMNTAVGITDLGGSGMSIIGSGSNPAWSPHGRRLAFARVVDGHPHLFVANADGSGATQITEGAEDDVEPAWSPDGRYIVFSSSRRNDLGWEQANLFVVRPDGEGLIQLTEGDRLSGRPDWASDGRIYFHANTGEQFHIWRITPLLAAPEPLRQRLAVDAERLRGPYLAPAHLLERPRGVAALNLADGEHAAVERRR